MRGKRDDEMTLRWLQFGVFSPIMRLHSSNSRFMRKEPWVFPGDIAGVMKAFLRLRHKLMPWLYTQNIRTSENSSALLRPMYYDYPEIPELYRGCKNQYMLGDCMMVCPVTSPKDNAANLSPAEAFLPEGEWVDFFTGLRYGGGEKVNLYRPMDTIPVLVRAGSIIPMDAADTPKNGDALPEGILLRVFPGADAEAELVEDNLELVGSAAYRRAVTRFTLRESEGMTLRIYPAEGECAVLPEGRRYTVELCGFANCLPDAADCAYEAHYDEEKRSLFLTLDADAAQGATLTWHSVPALPETDWREAVDRLLENANIEYEKKDAVSRMAAAAKTSVAFLAQLHTFDLPAALYGAMLEVFLVR